MSPDEEFARLADPYRHELLVHCYRMLGSVHDAEDLVQETYLRAWRGSGKFEARSSLRTWLDRIATRTCLNALEQRERRVLPSGLGASDDPGVRLSERRGDVPWLEPLPEYDVAGESGDPAAIVARRDSTRLALIAALQHLPARQRGALLLRDVLGWPAVETADLLGISTAAANSALQRARRHLARLGPTEDDVADSTDVDEQLLQRFIAAFQDAGIDALARLLREDVELQMPPIPTWFAGRDAVAGFFATRVLPGEPWRPVPTRANGCPAVASYVRAEDGRWHAHSLQVLQTRDGLIARIYAFLDTSLFEVFDLPVVEGVPGPA